MPLVYCERWNNKLGKPIHPYEVKEARNLHELGEPYTVAAIGPEESAERYLEIALRSGHVRVHFADDFRRVVATYTFHASGDRLFLGETTLYTYDSGSAKYLALFQCEKVETYRFDESGNGSSSVRDKKTGEDVTRDLHLTEGASLESHYEPIPAFGVYASIARPYRDQPPIPFA